MQNCRINLPLLFLLPFFYGVKLEAKSAEFQLRQADSLFAVKKYTQSLAQYEQLLSQGYESPAMLLRMAYIEEGLQRYAHALYYLNRYYRLEVDERVWQKITALASQQNLTGYEMNLLSHWMSLYYVNRPDLIRLNFMMAIILTALLWFYRKTGVKRMVAILQIVVIAFLLLQLNVRLPEYAIVAENGTPVMSGPSAGADVLGSMDSGHRLKVVGSTDVWAKVTNGKLTGYIRAGNLLIL